MPSVRAEEFRRLAARLGSRRERHGGREIGPPVFHKILTQLGVSQEEFRRLC